MVGGEQQCFGRPIKWKDDIKGGVVPPPISIRHHPRHMEEKKTEKNRETQKQERFLLVKTIFSKYRYPRLITSPECDGQFT